MFLGPAGRAIAFQWYIFIQKRTLVRGEALITQLVYEHSLRIRLNADNSTEQKEAVICRADAVINNAATSKNTPIAAGGTANSETETSADPRIERSPSASVASTTPDTKTQWSGKTPKQSTSSRKENGGDKAKSDANLMGRIQNLITTDLNNIVYGQDFLLLCTHHCAHLTD